MVKTSNAELRNELIRKKGDLKSVRETAKAFEIAKEENDMIKSGCKAKDDQEVHAMVNSEVSKITRPGRHSMRNRAPDRDNPAANAKAGSFLARGNSCLR